MIKNKFAIFSTAIRVRLYLLHVNKILEGGGG